MIFNPHYYLFSDIPEPIIGNVRFSSETSFTIVKNYPASFCIWDGIMEYSTDDNNWHVWDGSTITAGYNGYSYNIYFRGRNNTYISNSNGYGVWTVTGSNIYISGDMENLLDYNLAGTSTPPTVAASAFNSWFAGGGTTGNTVSIVSAERLRLPRNTAFFSYQGMFSMCKNLVKPPVLPATSLAQGCYSFLFNSCEKLEYLPALIGTPQSTDAYSTMFSGCKKIKISETQSETYDKPYIYPTVAYNYNGMFNSTGGEFKGTPSLNTQYYTSNGILPVV